MQSRGSGSIISRANDLENIVLNTLGVKSRILRKLAGIDSGQWPNTCEDIRGQLGRLFPAGFLRDTPFDWLGNYPRYLKAMENRVDRLSGQYSKDRKYMDLLQPLAALLDLELSERPGLCLESAEAMHYRWMLEELRVSLFAQSLGTRLAVSQRRLEEQWALVKQWLGQNPY